jgi:hypothetical protein
MPGVQGSCQERGRTGGGVQGVAGQAGGGAAGARVCEQQGRKTG